MSKHCEAPFHGMQELRALGEVYMQLVMSIGIKGFNGRECEIIHSLFLKHRMPFFDARGHCSKALYDGIKQLMQCGKDFIKGVIHIERTTSVGGVTFDAMSFRVDCKNVQLHAVARYFDS